MLMGKYLGDIVVGGIGQPQCHKCIKKQKNIVKEKEERHLWHYGWPMSPTTMSPIYFVTSATHVDVIIRV